MTEVCELPAGNPENTEITRILKETKTIAVVGLSPREDRPSHRVAAYLKSQGYTIIPVRPKIKEILGEKAYGDLSEIPPDIQVDMVDIFRRPSAVLPIVEAAIKRGNVKVIWMQERIVNNEAREKGLDAGLDVVMDKCALKEHKKIQQ